MLEMSIGNHFTKFMDIRVGTEIALIQVETQIRRNGYNEKTNEQSRN